MHPAGGAGCGVVLPGTLRVGAGLGSPPLPPRLIAPQPAQAALRHEVVHGAEVAVPAPVVERDALAPVLGGDGAQQAGLLGGGSHRLVDDDVAARSQHRHGDGHVRVVGRGHHHQVEVGAGEQLIDRRHDLGAGVPVVHRGLATDIGGDHRDQVQGGGGVDERRVEQRTTHPVADEPDAHRTDRAAFARPCHRPSLAPHLTGFGIVVICVRIR